MNLREREWEASVDFRNKGTLGLAFLALLILTPFSINNFIQGRTILGVGSLAIVAIVAVPG